MTRRSPFGCATVALLCVAAVACTRTPGTTDPLPQPTPLPQLSPPETPVRYRQSFTVPAASDADLAIHVEQTVLVTHAGSKATVRYEDVAVWLQGKSGPPAWRHSAPAADPEAELELELELAETWGFMGGLELEVTLDDRARVARVEGLNASVAALDGLRDPMFRASLLEGALARPELLWLPLDGATSDAPRYRFPAPLWGPRVEVPVELTPTVTRADAIDIAFGGTPEVLREWSPSAAADRRGFASERADRTQRLATATLSSGVFSGGASIDRATGMPSTISWTLAVDIAYGDGSTDTAELVYTLERIE